MSDVTQILEQIAAGDRAQLEPLFSLVYNDLREGANARLALERGGHSFQATDLVHETFIRLVGPSKSLNWTSRRHFFGAAAKAMRRILVERARRRLASKRHGGRQRIELDADQLVLPELDPQLVELDGALLRLAEAFPEKAELVELRFFAGLTIDEAADSLGYSPATAKRQWRSARAWLLRELDKSE